MEKQKIAEFLDTANDFLSTGYKSKRQNYIFNDNVSSNILSEGIISQENLQKDVPADDSLEKITEEIKSCNKCSLCEKRLNAVPGEGVKNPVVMVIGEGPGEDEDKQGRPFVGRAGVLLDKMLSSIGLSRGENVFIANTVKCRPPFNREPRPEETEACSGFLQRQIKLLKPKYILAAGRVSAHTLLKTKDPIGKMRGNFTSLTVFEDTYTQEDAQQKQCALEVPLLVTYHPAAILRNDDLRRPAWEDLKLLRSKLDSNIENPVNKNPEN